MDKDTNNYKDRFTSDLVNEQVLNEYAHMDPMMHANSTSVKKHGKSIMRTGRKHENVNRKEYAMVNNIVNTVKVTGGDRHVAGKMLDNLLDQYNMSFVENHIKGVSKSNVAIFMFVDNNGQQRGIVHVKNDKRVFPNLVK